MNRDFFKIQEGALTGIIGPNGAGKSTLLKAMLNIYLIREMSPLIMKTSIKTGKDCICRTKADIDFTFPIKVKECVSMGTYAGMKVFKELKMQNGKSFKGFGKGRYGKIF